MICLFTILFMFLFVSGNHTTCIAQDSKATAAFKSPYVVANYKANNKIIALLERKWFKPCSLEEEMMTIYSLKPMGPNKGLLINPKNTIKGNLNTYPNAKGWYEGYVIRCNTRSLSYNFNLSKCILIGNKDFSIEKIRKQYLEIYGTEGFADVSNYGFEYLVRYRDRYIVLGIEKLPIPSDPRDKNIPTKYALIYKIKDSTDYIVNEILKRKELGNK